MKSISSRYISMLHSMMKNDIPFRVMEKARECFIDYLSVTIAGAQVYKDRNLAFIKNVNIEGTNHIIGLHETVDVRTAIMINAFNAHCLELDDSHRIAMTHLGAPIFSVLLGVSEVYSISIKDLLKAAVIGYEAAVRLANAIQPSHKIKGFHVSGTCCTIGCAMAVCALFDYTEEQMNSVLSAACTSAAGLLGISYGKSELKPYNIACAATNGVNAALYGSFYIGSDDILGNPQGFFKVMSDEYNTDRLFDEGYAIESIYQKLYAACRHCHAPMEAMLHLKSSYKFVDEDINHIVVKTYNLAIKGHDHTEISGISSAKQSIPYGVAVACINQDCGIDAFSDLKVNDKRILALSRRVYIEEDMELTAAVPDKRAATVIVHLNDGKEYSERVDYAKGEPENPISKEELEHKFFSLIETAGISIDNGNKIKTLVNDGEEELVEDLFQWI